MRVQEILLWLSLAALAGAQPVTLVENGRAGCAIVVSNQVSPATASAARELQTYLRKISQATVQIRTQPDGGTRSLVFVGTARDFPAAGAESLGREGFRIHTSGNRLYLVGKDDAGTEFAVYTFLEKLGVRWLWPGELGEVVPRRMTIRLGSIDETSEPHFKWRNRGPGGALWGASSGPTEMRARELLLGVTPEHQRELALWEKRNKWGGLKIYGGHSLGEIFPPEKYARLRPDYYALVNGKRAVPGAGYDYKHGGQVCTTHPGVIQAAVAWVRDFFNLRPDFDGVHITMNDGGGFCECDRCRALDSGDLLVRPGIEADEAKKAAAKDTIITDRIFTFANQVAAEVEKTHPGKYILSMAYSRYIEPPKRITLHSNVIPQFCLWSAYRHANPEMKQQHERIAAGWARAARRSGIYEYFVNGSWPGMHRLVTAYIADSIKSVYRQGMDLYQPQCGDDFAINGINYYVAGKLLWDTSLSEREILEDFYAKGFGPAAPAVKRFHQRLAEAWTTATRDGRDVSCNSLQDTRLLELFTTKLLGQTAADLREAAELAGADPVIRRRVEFYRQGLRYTELTVEAVRAVRKVDLTEKADSPELKRLVTQALSAWEQREKFVALHKNDSVLAYFWVQYHNQQRAFNPLGRLKEMAACP